MPRPNSSADVPVAAADSVSRSSPLMAMAPSVATAIGTAPTRNSHGLRNTTTSSSRIAATDVTLFSVASRPHDRLGLDGNPVAAGVLDRNRRAGRRISTCGHLGARLRLDPGQAIEQPPRELAVERGPSRRRHHQPAAPVGRDIAAAADVDARERSIAGEPIADEREEAQRIGLDESAHVGRGRSEQIARSEQGRAHARFGESIERLARGGRANQRERAVLEVGPVLVGVEQAGVDPGDLGQRAQAPEIGVDQCRRLLDLRVLGRLEDDVELIVGAEPLEIPAERLQRGIVLRQERQDVRAERHPQRQRRGQDREARHGRQRQPSPAAREDEQPDDRGHSTCRMTSAASLPPNASDVDRPQRTRHCARFVGDDVERAFGIGFADG